MKTPKFQRLNGWDLPVGNDPLDIVAWTSLQTALHSKKDRKKSKSPAEDLTNKHVPNYRCSALEEPTEFERNSLHRRLFVKEITATEQAPIRPIKRSKTTISVSSVRTNQSTVLQKVVDVSEENYQETKSRDDIDVLTRVVQKELDSKNENVPKRSRSVPVPYIPDRSEQNPSFRRLLYYARKYGSKDEPVEEEDEGYGSKTPSAEDKDVTSLFEGFSAQGFRESSVDNNGNAEKGKKFAKFLYTHQIPRATSLFEESEDERANRFGRPSLKYYKTGYVEEKDNLFVRRMLTRSHTSVGQYESSSFHNIEDMKPAIVPRKITIQNAQEDDTTPRGEQPTAAIEKKTFYEPHKTIVKQNAFAQSQSDRPQYPVNCTSPEFKFAHLTQRPTSKKQQRDSNPSSSMRKGLTDSAKKRRTPNFELFRAHTSVCMPLGDLLPAVDRSLKRVSASKSKQPQSPQVSQSMPETLSSILSVRKSYDEVQQAGLEYIMNNHGKGIVSSPFRNSNATTNTESSTSVKTASDKPVKAQTTTPSRISLDDFASVSSLSTSREETKAKPPLTTSNTPSKQREGVRFTAHPDKDTKKKLRDAFSRFYNKQPYGANSTDNNWTEELKFMWNT